MALRIFVNQELENLKNALNISSQVINVHGKIAVISFHSLEDKIVKNFFKELVDKNHFKFVNKKVIIPK